MNIRELQRHWDKMGRTDPLWYVLSQPDKKGNKWRIDELYKTGEKEIDGIIKYIGSLGINIQRKKALDFGCGVGRLTHRLTAYFDEVYGVDIALSMIELAKKYNRYPDKCRYYLNDTDNLRLFSDSIFNFIYTNITLQHMEPQYSKNYIREFLRILAPEGLLIFQIPSEPVKTMKRMITSIVPSILLDRYHKIKYRNLPTPKMYYINKKDVIKFLEENRAEILDIKDKFIGKGWVSFQYCVTR